MKRALSPYNYSTPYVSVASGLTCTSYTLQLYIWDDAIGSKPESPQETWTKLNPTASTGNDVINISRVILDYLAVEPPTGTGIQLIDGNAQWFVRTEVVYITSAGQEMEQYGLSEDFARAYSYGNEGENIVTTPDDILLDGREFKVNRSGVFILPLYAPSGVLGGITVDSFPSGEIALTPTATVVNDSAQLTQYLWIDCSQATTDTTIVIDYKGIDVTLIVEDEYKYTPMDIVFLNKYGVCQTLTFFKEFESDLKVTREKYETDNGQPSAGFHQFRNINVQGQESFKIQSGWVDETMNETFKQMLLSEQVWHFDGTNHIPLNITSSSLNYKTQKKDRLIQYEIDFDYSYNVINNI